MKVAIHPGDGQWSPWLCAVIGAVLFQTTGAVARIVPVGPVFQVNTYTTGIQYYQSTAALADGGFVVAWRSKGQDGDGFGVYARAFSGNGEPPSPEVQVNTTTSGGQFLTSVTAMPDGSFVVAWVTDTLAGKARRFNRNGGTVGGEFDVPGGLLAATPSGDFVVISGDEGPDGSGRLVRAQLLKADGVPKGSAFYVSAQSAYHYQYDSRVAVRPDDSFIVVWHDRGVGPEEQPASVNGRLVDHSGFPITPEFEVGPIGKEGHVDVCADGQGQFIVVWNAGYDVLYRRYDSLGNPLTLPQDVTPEIVEPEQVRPRVACTDGGGFIVAWNGLSNARPDDSAGKYFSAGDTEHGELFNIGPAGSPIVAAVARDNSFVLTWPQCRDRGSDCDLFGQRFNLTGPAPCPADCDQDGRVTIDELVISVSIALDPFLGVTLRCLAADANLDGDISIAELVNGVNKALRGCP